MRIDPENIVKEDPFKDLTKVQKVARWVAIAVAFVGVFIWFYKIVF